ncbi:hypothetical protein QQP08_016572 [Theobroma cacao]|nr:hypothetical protein QQP08_016572 [Theobroma cacao]
MTYLLSDAPLFHNLLPQCFDFKFIQHIFCIITGIPKLLKPNPQLIVMSLRLKLFKVTLDTPGKANFLICNIG